MIKTGADKNLSEDLVTKQKEKGTFDSPCMSVCNYEGMFHECQTCHMRKTEKNLWKSGDDGMKSSILRALAKRLSQ